MKRYLLPTVMLLCGMPIVGQTVHKGNVVVCGEKSHRFDAVQMLRSANVESLD